MESGGTLVFEGDESTGAIVNLEIANLTIESGGAMRVDGKGRQTLFVGFSSEPSEAPDDANACTAGAPGAGTNGNDFGGAAGSNGTVYVRESSTSTVHIFTASPSPT